jgi:hypothetical protein
MLPPERYPHVILPLLEFLLIESCPPEWKELDLYLIRDDEMVFYVGQSYTAFDRVWQHIYDAFKGRSTVGRFLLCNWPASLQFTVELMGSQSSSFAAQDNQLNAAERVLIERYTPCFNRALNRQPSSLPAQYSPPNVPLPITCPRSPNSLVRQARYHLKSKKQKAWMADEGLR